MVSQSLVAVLAAVRALAPVEQSASEVAKELAGLIRADDYPLEAIDKNEQGRVGVLIRVDDHGVVQDCIVESSSGHSSLDNRTCELVRARAKFKPAHNPAGRTVAANKHAVVNWQLSGGFSVAAPWANRSIIHYSASASPVCRTEFDGAMKALMSPPPTGCPAGIPTPPPGFTDASSDYELVLEQQFTTGALSDLEMREDAVIQFREIVQLDVDAKGARISCTIIEKVGEAKASPPDLCRDMVTEHFAKADGSPPGASFKAYFMFAAYTLKIRAGSPQQPSEQRLRAANSSKQSTTSSGTDDRRR